MQKIKIYKKNGFYKLKATQNINAKIEDIWEYFTEIKNLEKIMPNKYNIKVTQGRKSKLYLGKIFNIRMKILPFVYTNITSEIKAIEKERLFIDSQIFGPYKMWHHEHHFILNKDKSIQILDIVTYKLKNIPFMKILHKIFLKKEIVKTFYHRANRIKYFFKNKYRMSKPKNN
tara:strand:+ start:245 stop:763 length:519 start_codon:yes stop_codon:yes gene_type:complete